MMNKNTAFQEKTNSKAPLRNVPAKEKLRILELVDACSKPGEIGALIKRLGISSSRLSEWRIKRKQGALMALTDKRHQAAHTSKIQEEHDKMLKEQLNDVHAQNVMYHIEIFDLKRRLNLYRSSLVPGSVAREVRTYFAGKSATQNFKDESEPSFPEHTTLEPPKAPRREITMKEKVPAPKAETMPKKVVPPVPQVQSQVNSSIYSRAATRVNMGSSNAVHKAMRICGRIVGIPMKKSGQRRIGHKSQ